MTRHHAFDQPSRTPPRRARSAAMRQPAAEIRELASAMGNAAFARQLQRTLVLEVGEEANPGETTISASADLIQSLDDEELGHEVERLERVRKSPRSLRTPAPDEDIYLVAHGDDPGHPEVVKPNLGDFDAAGVVKLLETLLKPLTKPYTGTIYLSGCHTAARLYGEEGVRGGSLLDEVTLGLQKTKWAKKRLAPEVQIVGYPGQLMDKKGSAGVVSIESPYERAEHRRRGGDEPTSHPEDAAPFIPTEAEDSWVRRRWGQKPGYMTHKTPHKGKKGKKK
jgi:hypothetical protein